MPHNPYTLTFGKSPEQIIERLSQMNEVISTFRNEPPAQQAYIITGVRGSGKTVFIWIPYLRKRGRLFPRSAPLQAVP